MQVWMQRELLAPGMQNADHTGLCTEVSGVVPKTVECTPGGGKEAVVNGFVLVHGQLVQLGGQGENHMKVRHGQQVLSASCDPLFTFVPLALGAVPVAATVVAGATTGTHICMRSQIGCAAPANSV